MIFISVCFLLRQERYGRIKATAMRGDIILCCCGKLSAR